MDTLRYSVVETDAGSWLHAEGTDFLFAFVDASWSSELIAAVTAAFKAALSVPNLIKAAVKETSGEDVVNGLYLLNKASMITALNSINGMSMNAVDEKSEAGSGTATTINQQFFTAVLSGISGDVAPMKDYLNGEMGDLQLQTKKSTVTDKFGMVVGLISVEPVLNVVVTSFQYVFSDETTSDWVVKVNCGSHEDYSYNYSFTVVDYIYNP